MTDPKLLQQDQRTAERLVNRYLERMGGEDCGYIVDAWERALIVEIAVELHKARVQGRILTKKRRK